MTSPRPNKMVKRIFNTPQPQRFKSLHLSSTTITSETKLDQSESILHKVREKNIKKHHKQKVIQRGHLFDEEEDSGASSESDIENDENAAPPPPVMVSAYSMLV
jgi:hypothetical protein